MLIASIAAELAAHGNPGDYAVLGTTALGENASGIGKFCLWLQARIARCNLDSRV
jgi:hypothetical protein